MKKTFLKTLALLLLILNSHTLTATDIGAGQGANGTLSPSEPESAAGAAPAATEPAADQPRSPAITNALSRVEAVKAQAAKMQAKPDAPGPFAKEKLDALLNEIQQIESGINALPATAQDISSDLGRRINGLNSELATIMFNWTKGATTAAAGSPSTAPATTEPAVTEEPASSVPHIPVPAGEPASKPAASEPAAEPAEEPAPAVTPTKKASTTKKAASSSKTKTKAKAKK